LDDPGVATSARGLFRLGASAAANADEIVRNFNLDRSKLTIKDPVTQKDLQNANFREQFERLFPEIAGRDAGFQAAAFNVAYMVAAARGTTGRGLSDKELATTILNLGASLDDPKARVAALRETRRGLIEGFKTEFSVRNDGEEFTDLDSFLKSTEAGNQFDAMTLEDTTALMNDEARLNEMSTDDLSKLVEAHNKKKNKAK